MVSLKAAAAGGGRGVIPSAPTLSHGPTAGTFIIGNYDPLLRYSVTSGTIAGNTITVATNVTVQSEVVAYSQKGVIASTAKAFERRSITSSYVQVGTAPGSCSYYPQCGGPYDTGAGCTNCGGGSGGLCITCSGGGPIFGWVQDPTPSGFTESYGEWWRII